MNRKERWPANLGLTLINIVALSVFPLTLIGAAYFAQSRGWGLLNQMALPAAVLVGVNILGRSLISFLIHYLNHKVPLLWRLHRVHHLDTELDITSTVRGHPLEFPVSAVLGAPIAIVLGLTPWVLALYEVLDVAVTLWSHSNLRLPQAIGPVLAYFIVTPDLHRVHHSVWQPETDSNFGAVFPIWDLVFGTFRAVPRDGQEHMQLGLEGVRGREAHSLLWLLLSVTRDLKSRDQIG